MNTIKESDHSYLLIDNKEGIYPRHHFNIKGEPQTSEGVHLLALNEISEKQAGNKYVKTIEEKIELAKARAKGVFASTGTKRPK